MCIQNQRIEDWISAVAESKATRTHYLRHLHIFVDYAKKKWNMEFQNIVEEWREANRSSYREREEFLIAWSDVVRSFHTYIREKYAPLTVKNFLSILRSFFKFYDISIKVRLPKRACVIYHNKDLSREEIRQILTFASPRDRVIWLVMTESGMRVGTAVNLKYWMIKEDFEASKVPMKILLPSSSLKDHVGDRWTFIGEDGYNALKEYLEPRLPLEDDDYVFASEKQGKVVGDQFTPASLSTKFSRIIHKLELAKSRDGKPKRIRMHGLRKFFRNNIKSDSAFIKFWMGHSLGVDTHYISRDLEKHRSEYKSGYEFLRVFEPSLYSVAEHTARINQLEESLKKSQEENSSLKTRIDSLDNLTKKLERLYEEKDKTFYELAKRSNEDMKNLEAEVERLKKNMKRLR